MPKICWSVSHFKVRFLPILRRKLSLCFARLPDKISRFKMAVNQTKYGPIFIDCSGGPSYLSLRLACKSKDVLQKITETARRNTDKMKSFIFISGSHQCKVANPDLISIFIKNITDSL